MPIAPNWLQSLIRTESLPPQFEDLAVTHYLPLADAVVGWAKQESGPLVVGVNGAQGTGKSTMSKVLALALEHEHQLSCAIISIDDIYLTRDERSQLACDVHPLLQTRGVPGTHDVAMGIDLIQQLKARKTPAIPVFDKAVDDRAPKSQWVSFTQPVDVILFEGWCVGAMAQPASALTEPCNQLEKTEDADAAWRSYVNAQLETAYPQLFALMDRLVMLKAPDFECVYEWRRLQEDKLRLRQQGAGIMDDEQITRFIMHYERLTRWMFQEMPDRADCVLELSHDHSIATAKYLKR